MFRYETFVFCGDRTLYKPGSIPLYCLGYQSGFPELDILATNIHTIGSFLQLPIYTFAIIPTNTEEEEYDVCLNVRVEHPPIDVNKVCETFAPPSYY